MTTSVGVTWMSHCRASWPLGSFTVAAPFSSCSATSPARRYRRNAGLPSAHCRRPRQAMPPTAWYSDKLRTRSPRRTAAAAFAGSGVQIQRPASSVCSDVALTFLRQRGLAKIIHRQAHRRANQQPHRQLAQPAPDFTGHGLSPAALSPAPPAHQQGSRRAPSDRR